ncbi:hypothetical protein KKH56_07000 [bacterium]|nr:hypothetical protein [bacterium]MBU1487776.1 hypothetical protein [bacterium]
MKSYIFHYRKEKTREGEIVYRPVAYIHLKAKDGNWYLFDPYIDSGADLSLFTRSDCSLLGHELKKGREKLIGGVSGGLIRTYIHQVLLKIGETELTTEIAFAEIEEVPRLLGRKSIFNHFQINFDEKELKIHFTPTENITL